MRGVGERGRDGKRGGKRGRKLVQSVLGFTGEAKRREGKEEEDERNGDGYRWLIALLDAHTPEHSPHAGAFIVRRIVGIAGVADLQTIADRSTRVGCERRALRFGRRLLAQVCQKRGGERGRERVGERESGRKKGRARGLAASAGRCASGAGCSPRYVRKGERGGERAGESGRVGVGPFLTSLRPISPSPSFFPSFPPPQVLDQTIMDIGALVSEAATASKP